MAEIKGGKTIAAIIVLLLVSWFYWFQWRPMQIRNYCDQVAWKSAEIKTSEYVPLVKLQEQFLNKPGSPPSNWEEKTNFDESIYNWKYMQCLHSRGLK